MKIATVRLSAREKKWLDSKYPPGKGSGLIGKRSEEIVKIYFSRMDPNCKFSAPKNGADLEVVFSTGESSSIVEIKGTADSDIAWSKLKVSSEHTKRMLIDEGVPIYRVTKVFEDEPVIYVLRYGKDFELQPEARWAVKRVTSGRRTVTYDMGTRSVKHNKSNKKSKYSSLTEYLENNGGEEVTLRFAEAAKVLGFDLPSSAKRYRAFWANQTNTKNRPWAKAWQDAGYYVFSHKLSGDDGWVIFRRRKK